MSNPLPKNPDNELDIEAPYLARSMSAPERPKNIVIRSYTTSSLVSPISPKHIRKSSLNLSHKWTKSELLEVCGSAHKTNNIFVASIEDDELIPLAFFPLLATPSKDETDCVIKKTKEQDIKDEEPVVEKALEKESEELAPKIEPEVRGVQTSQAPSHPNADEIWDDVPMGPSDAILGIAEAYKKCTDPRKVNVAVGAYRDVFGKPWVLPSVRAAEKVLWDIYENKEYLPIEGDIEYIEMAMKFAYGIDMDLDHIAAVQTLSGTGACRIGGCFLAQFWPKHPIYVPDPTWGNHISIFHDAGLDVRKYRYYNKKTNGLDLEGMVDDITSAPEGSIILLHACAHNPTGCDPTVDEWKQIIKAIADKFHIAFFDSAYQGFASGDAEADAQPFRYAVSQHVPILLAQSFAKNFGLYGERCGTLSVVCGDKDQKERIMSELRCIIRPMYSSPPRHGSSIVKTVLSDDLLKVQYYQECQQMADRIHQMRTQLVESLRNVGSEHDWSHITRQIGMFAYTGLSESMCQRLTSEYAIFLTLNGRISIAGLNNSNVEYVAQAIHDVSHGQSIIAA